MFSGFSAPKIAGVLMKTSSKPSFKVTWAKFIDICKEKSIGGYRGRVAKLKEELVNKVDGVHLSTRKVQLDSWRAVALYLQLANRDR